MSNVVRVQFGAEREWENTRAMLESGLLALGAKHGEDPQRMLAKAECAYRVAREMVDGLPKLQVATTIPGSLTAEQSAWVAEAVRDAARQGMEAAISHALCAFMASVFELCSGSPAGRPCA